MDTLKELKETMLKELKENMTMKSHKIDISIRRDRRYERIFKFWS